MIVEFFVCILELLPKSACVQGVYSPGKGGKNRQLKAHLSQKRIKTAGFILFFEKFVQN